MIDSIKVLQVLFQTLVKPEEPVNALNSIDTINDPTGHDIQLKLILKTQAQLVDILVQTVSGIIQVVVYLAEKDNNDSKTFELALGVLKVEHEKMKG